MKNQPDAAIAMSRDEWRSIPSSQKTHVAGVPHLVELLQGKRKRYTPVQLTSYAPPAFSQVKLCPMF